MDSKKAKIISIVSIIALAAILVGATYAYFQAQTGEGSQTDIKINANTVDTFNFETGDPLSINLNQENFASGKGNQTGSTYAKAILTANNKTNSATNKYYLYLNISNNTFGYTQDENTPEIILTIKDGSNTELTSVTGLSYKTVTDGKGNTITGFDITNKNGLITIFSNRSITTTSATEETWNVTVTFVNYNLDQSANAGKKFNAKLMILKEEYKQTIKDYVISKYTGTQGENGIYYHDSSLDNGAGDNSYRYTGGDYVLTDAGKATGATMMIGYNSSVTTALIDFYCDGTKQYVGYGSRSCSTHYYQVKGDTTQYQSYDEALNAGVEKGYLTKDNVKNFVCFGSDASSCPTDNLYRIIGVFNNQVKLVKYDYAKSSLLGTNGDFAQEDSFCFSGKQWESSTSISLYYWNVATNTNTWSESALNNVNLNANFIDNIGITWADKIATTTWKVGGGTYTNLINSIPKKTYQYEVGSSASSTTYEAKIGLMYVSDYYYGASPSAWTLVGYNSSVATKDYRFSKGENWLYGGVWEWTISLDLDNPYIAFFVDFYGNVSNFYGDVGSLGAGVRPSFSLNQSVTYVSGSGTQSDPIRIN